MKRWLIIGSVAGIVALLGVGAVGALTFAQSPVDGDSSGRFRGGPRGFGSGEFGGFGSLSGFGAPMGADFMARSVSGFGKGPGGEVTTIDGSSLTVQTRNDETVTVTSSDDTKVMLVETHSEGSISDIQVGDKIGVHGQKNDDGTVDAQGIVVLPRGDMAGGKVTAVNGVTITVDNPKDGETTIITNGDTQFKIGPDGDGSLEDVATDSFVMALGEKQDDDSLAARQVMVGKPGMRGPGGPPHDPGHGGPPPQVGEVSAVNDTSFTIETFREEETITVLTDDSTEYRTRSGEDVSFEDIMVGGKVMVSGRPVEGAENTVQAEVVGVKK